MKDIFTVSFIGQREFYFDPKYEENLFELLREIIKTHGFVNFYIGRNGEFDIFTASIIMSFLGETRCKNARLTVVLPHEVENLDDYTKYYGNVITPNELTNFNCEELLPKLNEWLIDHSDLLVCFVEHNQGKSFEALKYADRKSVKCVNLFL